MRMQIRCYLTIMIAMMIGREAVAEDAQKPAAAGDRIICKRDEATGTRIPRGRICKKKSAWDALEKLAEDLIRGIEKGSATVRPESPAGWRPKEKARRVAGLVLPRPAVFDQGL